MTSFCVGRGSFAPDRHRVPKSEEHEEGEFRAGHWKTKKPMSVAGFNFGEYASASVASEAHSIDVYANRELEEDLRKPPIGTARGSPPLSLPGDSVLSTGHPVVPPPPPLPARPMRSSNLEKRSILDPFLRDIQRSVSFPQPQRLADSRNLWAGLARPALRFHVFLFAFEAQQRAGLSTTGQEHFTELVPYHEVAHQWWGQRRRLVELSRPMD